MAQARALLAGCTDCAATAADLQLITRATATSVVPVRPRDFRITPAQAASARGSILDRIRRWLGSPGSAPVRPLAGAGVAMGLVLVLLAPSLGPAGGGGDAQPVTAVEATSVLQATEPPEGPNVAGAEMYVAGTDDAGSAQADTQLRMTSSPAATQHGDTAIGETATDAPDRAVAETRADGEPGGSSGASMDDTTFALTLLGIVLVGIGLLVLLLTWLARRWQDPLLR
jgi:hypothetical protein